MPAKSPEDYREEAGRLRAQAGQVRQLTLRLTLLEIATLYDTLAGQVERLIIPKPEP